MTAEEKKDIAFFIDLASGWARGGYFPAEREYNFSDDPVAGSLTAIGSLTTKGGLTTKCGLGEGAPSTPRAQNPLVMVIGDVSDSGEDAQLLNKMLGSIGLSKESNCFITDVIEYEDQLQSMKPRFILSLGESSSQSLLHSAEPIEKLRGRLMDCKTAGMTIPLVATYHPNDLLRNGELKRPAWDDLKMLRAALGSVESGAK